MAGLSSPGLGSGLDVNGLVTQLVSLERRPITALDRKEAVFQAQLTAFGRVKGALSALQSAASAISTATGFASARTSVGDAGVLLASAGSGAAAGSYQIDVQTLAKAQKLASSTVFATTGDAVGTGAATLTITLGSYATGAFVAKSGATPVTVNIGATANTLDDVRDAINAADAGVTASLVNDGTGYRLVLTSDATGEENAVRVVSSNATYDDLAYNGAATPVGGMTQKVGAADATFTIDGIDIRKPSNTVTDALEGVTLTLKKENASTTITVAADTAATRAAIESFVKAYNDAATALKAVSGFNAATGTGSTLTGDSAVRSVQSQLRAVLGATLSGTTLTALSDVGIAFQKDGSLAVNGSKLQAALDDPAKNVAQLFIDSGTVKGYAAQVKEKIDQFLASDGAIAARTDGINSSIKDIGKRREALQLRLEAAERRYRAQFTALDTLISSLNQTSSFLTQQLANLPKTEG